MISHTLKILFLGDVFGAPGRDVVRYFLPQIKSQENIDLAFANVENIANGKGISKRLVLEMIDSGVDFMTSGNHVYDVHDSLSYFAEPHCKVIRPYNLPQGSPGKGYGVVQAKNGTRVGVLNLMGRIFMDKGVNMPFDAFDDAYQILKHESDILLVDFHAETTSEKRALGWYANGKAQLVVGTHTHVPTADEEILNKGTAYISDLGMCGPYDSVIGMEKEAVIYKMRTNLYTKFEVAKNDVRLCGVICTIDTNTKKALSIERICRKLS